MRDINSMSRGECLDPKQAVHYHAQLGLQEKGHAIKGLVVYNNLDPEPLDLLNGLALDCYQPSLEVLIVLNYLCKLSLDTVILYNPTKNKT